MNRGRLFLGSCLALIATAVGFAAVGDILGTLKAQFVLSNESVGYISGARIWGFTLSIFVLGPLCNVLGMRNLIFFALICHVAGTLTMILADGFWPLFVGALILALGNGTVEAVCNPLVATVYSDQKTKKLNQFHVWFPGGIVLGALGSYAIAHYVQLPAGSTFKIWQLQLALVLIPAVLYGLLFIGQTFPATERVQSGVTFGGMLAGAFGRPLFWILLICMAITASLELGPGSWIPSVLTAGGIAGILVLAYINGLMAILRFFAGPVVHRLSPTGILVTSAILAGIGLYWFSFAETVQMAFAAATVFAIGVCYFWPTMLGVTSERVPRSGELGLALVGGTGMLVVGVLTAPQMGKVADHYLFDHLDKPATVAVLRDVREKYPPASASLPKTIQDEVRGAVDAAHNVLADYDRNGVLPEATTADALRNAAKNAPTDAESKAITSRIGEILNPADNFGGRMSFRYLAPFAGVIIVIFGILFLRDRAAGGYRAEKLAAHD